MPIPHKRELIAAIWPESLSSRTEVWAVLDGARDEAIAPMVQGSYADKHCLYAGDLTPALESVAPYMIRLEPESYVANRVLSAGWGKAWGIIVRTETSARNLRLHLRRFLKVQDEQGKRLLFRYYDPRVLRVYLPTCTADELRTFFGPIQSFLTEAEDPAFLVDFAWDGIQLVQTRIALHPGGVDTALGAVTT